MRPLNGIVGALSLIPAIALASGRIEFPVRVAFASFFIASFGYVINDLFDFRTDKINKPERVFPSRILSAWDGINVAIACFVIAFAFLAELNWPILLFFGLVAVALFLYSFRISAILILSNVWVALLCSSAFLLGGLISEASPANWRLLSAAIGLTFLFHLGREIVKDIEDVEGDRFAGRRTLPIALGRRKAAMIASAVLLAMVLATYAIWISFGLTWSFMFAVTFSVNIPVAFVIFAWVLKANKTGARKASLALKVIMLPALAALLVAGLDKA
jgi:4-hydroxybenzoate polyprenyltransferase